jgi:hypothetical protein
MRSTLLFAMLSTVHAGGELGWKSGHLEPFLFLRRIIALLTCLTCVAPAQKSPTPGEWQSLFDGKSLAGWRETPFTSHGAVRIENGEILLGAGAPMTGITWTGQYPHSNYEIHFEAARLAGGDFFASLTFPVQDAFCTWVTGGWGGDIVGLSSIDGWDASDNETRTYFEFEKEQWYSLRLQVNDDRIQAWIDERPIIDVKISGRGISLRPGEIKLSAPLGFASYNSTGAIRKIEYRLLQTRANR